MNWISFKERDLFEFPPKPTGEYLISFKYQHPPVTECDCGYIFNADDPEWERCYCITGASESHSCFDILFYAQHRNISIWKEKTYNDMHIKGYPPVAEVYDPKNNKKNDDIKFYYWCEIKDPDYIGRY